MGVLTAKARKRLPSSDFAGPARTYPDENVAHARDALARSGGKPIATVVRNAVLRKFPKLRKPS